MNGSIIVFSGMDGAGKSTQIELLKSALTKAGRKSKTLWARGGYTPGMNYLKSLVRRRSQAIPAAGPSESRTAAFHRPIVRRVWLTLSILDLILLYGVWLRVQKRIGTVVICDRYLGDTALDFKINFPQESVEKWWLWRILEFVAPRPDVAILLLVTTEESQRRSLYKQEPFPDSAEVLAVRLQAYQSWITSTQADWLVLDGSQPIEVIEVAIAAATFGCGSSTSTSASTTTVGHVRSA